MNTIYGKILWRTSLPVLLLLFLAVSCKQSEQHSSWEKKYDSFYRSVTDSLTTKIREYTRLNNYNTINRSFYYFHYNAIFFTSHTHQTIILFALIYPY